MRDLLERGVLAGLKDSSGTVSELHSLIDSLGPSRNAALLTGADLLADVALGLGADGLIPGLANARPDLFAELLRATREGDQRTADAYQRAITSLTGIFSAGIPFGLGRHASELGALKHLLRARGVIASTRLTSPLTPYPTQALEVVDKIVADLDERLAGDLEESGPDAD